MTIYLDSEDSHFRNADSYYLDSEDSYYLNNLPQVKESVKPKTKAKRDRGGIAAIVYSLSIIGIETAYTIYTAVEIAFG